jgi:hypothetical protein
MERRVQTNYRLSAAQTPAFDLREPVSLKTQRSPHSDHRARLEPLYHHLPLSLVLPLFPEYLPSYRFTKPDKPDNSSSIWRK